MGLEAATYLNQLVDTNPLIGDQFASCSAHLRLIKSVLQNTFQNIGAAVTASDADLNTAAGLGAGPGEVIQLLSGTIMYFGQATAPTGWTQLTTINDSVLRVTNAVAGDTGGSWTLSGVAVVDAGHVLTIAEMPAHTHPYNINGASIIKTFSETQTQFSTEAAVTGSVGGGAPHVHTISFVADGTWRPAYLDVIACTKD